MFALVAAVIAAVAWAMQVLGDGLDNPWAWIFATVFFVALHLMYAVAIPFDRIRRP